MLIVQQLPFKHQDDLGAGLVHLVQPHHVRVGLGRLQHGDLVQDVGAAVLTLPSLAQELGGVLVPCGLFHTLLHHCKLSSGRRAKEMISRLIFFSNGLFDVALNFRKCINDQYLLRVLIKSG